MRYTVPAGGYTARARKCCSVTLAKYKFLRGNARYDLPFGRPILDFRELLNNFFAMVLDAVPKVDVVVNANEFSVRQSNVLGENQARYSIYGGGTSVSMQVDRLTFDFPGIVTTDLPVVWKIIKAIHDALPTSFPDIAYDRIETNSGVHLGLADVSAVENVLSRFPLPDVERAFGKDQVIARPVGKIDLVSADQKWSYAITVERSLLQPTAIFAYAVGSHRGLSATMPFEQKLDQIVKISKNCFALLGLEPDANQ